jgi:hypothetical protein
LAIVLSIYEVIDNKQLPPEQKTKAARVAFITIVLMSIVPANFPQSHELRYFMFWGICLVSLNLSLVCGLQDIPGTWRWLQPKYLGIICLMFLSIVWSQIGNAYAKPSGNSLHKQIAMGVKPELLNQIQPNDRVCLIAKHLELPQRERLAALKFVFLYSSPFHPELNYPYSIKATIDPQTCGDRKIIPRDSK